METIPKKYRDMAMRIFIDYRAKRKPGHFIEAAFLYKRGFPETIDAQRTTEVLRAMGYLEIRRETLSDGRTAEFVSLTDPGIRYFEDEADRDAETKAERAHNWKIAVFSAFAGALVSEPLWTFLHWLSGLFGWPPVG